MRQVAIVDRLQRLMQLSTVGLLVLGFRSWHLAVVEHESRVAEAERPKRRETWIYPERGLIMDRYGAPLAINQEDFCVSVRYADMRQVPRTAWIEHKGQRKRCRARTHYIVELSRLLGQELALDAGRIEDLIHSSAALIPHVPFPIKTKLTQQQYLRLKQLERDWPGLVVEVNSRRVYPAGQVVGHVTGYLGRISAPELQRWRDNIKSLSSALDGDVTTQTHLACKGIEPRQLQELYEQQHRMGYRPTDWYGKCGIEASAETRLRGRCGLDVFEADTSGRRLRALATPQPATCGEALKLSISLKLQQEAEKLLREAEGRPESHRAPSIAGGAIVAMDPNSGEILALASYPSYDPNDLYAGHHDAVLQALENQQWLAEVWDGLVKPPPARGSLGAQQLTLPEYLSRLLGAQHPISQCLLGAKLGAGLQLIAECSAAGAPSDSQLEMGAHLLPHWPTSRAQRLLALDLLRLIVGMLPEDLIDSPLNELTLVEVRQAAMDLQLLKKELKEALKEWFHQHYWPMWREKQQKRWLALQRQKERAAHRPNRPYLELLDREERQQLNILWEQQQDSIIAAILGVAQAEAEQFSHLHSMLSGKATPALQRLQLLMAAAPQHSASLLCGLCGYRQLAELDLVGRYPCIARRHRQTLQQLAAAFHPPYGVGFMRSQAFQHTAPMGSVFKLVTAWEALRQSAELHGCPRYDKWTIYESAQFQNRRCTQIGTGHDGKPLPRIYKGGRLPLTAYRHFGHMDLLQAIERSSNPYFALLAGDVLSSPLDLLRAAQQIGLGSRTGIALPAEAAGRLPQDLATNRSGLYAFAMGQHEFRCTPLQTAVMLSALVNGGKVLQPQIELSRDPILVRKIDLSPEVKAIIHRGMWQVVHGASGSARNALVQQDHCTRELKACYARMAPFMVGKTGTAEILEAISPDPEQGVVMVKHVCSAMAIYPTARDAQEGTNPELVVVAFLRFARGGRETAPLTAWIAEQWRLERARHDKR